MISVIVPVYNPGKWFESCVQSILEQTYQEIELILVDDGSTDGSEKLCDVFAEKDNRIKVIHLKNGGVSKARNVGIEAARGEYIAFIDSDDWIEKNTFEQTLNRIKEDDSELAIYAMQIDRYTDNKVDSTILEWSEDTNFSVQEIAQKFEQLFYKDYLSSSCTKILKKDVIEKYSLRFNKSLVMYEDLYFVLDYISHIDKISILKKAYYHYRMDTSVVAVSKRKTDNLLKNLDIVVKQIIAFVNGQGVEINGKVNNVIVDMYIIFLYKLFVEKNSFFERLKGIRKLERTDILQKALCDCPKFTKGSRFYRILIWGLRRKLSLVTYCLYYKKYH